MVAAASSGISPAPSCRRAKRSTPSTSTPCPWSARRRSWRSPPATAGSIKVPISCSLARPAEASRHLAAALGLALVQNGRRVLFIRTTDLVQRLQVARRELGLEAAITKLDKYQLLILDDIAYVTKDQAETSVLFELIAARYERRSLLITANQPFGEWGKIFTDKAMTLAAIDRLVHHATILEMNVESYRRKAALKRKRGPAD